MKAVVGWAGKSVGYVKRVLTLAAAVSTGTPWPEQLR